VGDNGLFWRKSTRSANTDNCVEVAITSTMVGIRDSKRLDKGELSVSREEFAAFTRAVKAGEFDF
jgi:hypothetical protein